MQLNDYLKANGISARDIAAKCGFTYQAIYQVIRGQRRPGWELMLAIRKATAGVVMPNDFIDMPSRRDRLGNPEE